MRVVALGYIRVQPNSDHDMIVRLRREIADYAKAKGFALAAVFTESELLATSAFAALIDAVQLNKASKVLVPSMSHLGHIEGVRNAMRDLLEDETGAKVVALDRTVGPSHPFPTRR